MTENLCRVCLTLIKEGVAISQELDGVQISEIISKIAQIVVEIQDPLPQEICTSCLILLQKSVEFLEKAQSSDKELRRIKLEPEEQVECLLVEPIKIEEPVLKKAKNENVSKTFTKKKRRVKAKSGSGQCCMCDETFANQLELKQHCDTVHPNGAPEDKFITVRHKFKCSFCHRKFRMKKFLLEHFLNKNFVEPTRYADQDPNKRKKYEKKSSKRICSTCGITLHDQRSLVMHEATRHSTRRNWICEIDGCKSAFGHEFALKKHTKACHSVKKFECDYCGKKFSNIQHLKRHIFSHIKPWKCNECQRSYANEYVLKAHITASHSEVEYPFQCEMCFRKYKWKEDLKSHRNAVHFGKFAYVCKNCGKGYTSGSTKKWHENRCTLGVLQ